MIGNGTHLIICKNPKALEYLFREEPFIAGHCKRGESIEQGDALIARDVLKDAGFKWNKDFYIIKVTNNI